MELPFDLTVRCLRDAGYEIKIKEIVCPKQTYRFAIIKENNIHGGFCEPNGESYFYIDGRVAADHADCFDKWSKCPLVVELPTTDQEAKKLIEHLAWLSTAEGFKWSNSYDYLDDPKLPRVN